MKRFLVESVIVSVLYFILALVVSRLVPFSFPVLFFIILVLIVLTIDSLRDFLRKHFTSRIHLSLSNAEFKLNEFNIRLNSIVDYYELTALLYALIDEILPVPHWALYILEQKNYHLKKTKLYKIKTRLPVEIEPFEISEYHSPHYMKDIFPDQQLTPKMKTLQDAGLDVLLAFHGKSRGIALLFFSSENMSLFRDRIIRPLTRRVFSKTGQILENTALYLDVLQLNLEIKKLFEVSQKLLSSLNTQEILEFLLDALADVVAFDAGVIFLLDNKSGELIQKVSRGYQVDTEEINLKLGQGACGWVAEHGELSLIEDVSNAEYYYPFRKETQSQVTIPLKIQDDVIGVICLESDDAGHFTNDSIELLILFANQAAIALNNAKQYEISMAKTRLEHELIDAAQVQKVLLPKRPPAYRSLEISFINIPSKIVSGDLFDVVAIDDNRLGVLIGDISGKGASAAIMMSLLLAGFRAYKKSQFTVCEVVARLNNLLQESTSAGNYATFFYGIIDIRNRSVTYTNAGHNPPLIVHADGSHSVLFGGGLVLGYLPNETYIQKTESFYPGDVLVLYTDGITEIQNSGGEEFGETRLLEHIVKNRTQTAFQIRRRVFDAIHDFSDGKEAGDDLTMVVVKYLANQIS